MFLGLSVVDWIIIVLAIAAGWTGWRHGFVVGLLSFIGFVGGAFLGLQLVPHVLSGLRWGLGVSVLAVGLVLVVAFIAQAVLTATGGWVRSKIADGPARAFDASAGAALAVAGLLVATWAVGLAASTAAIPTVSAAVRESRILPVVDRAIPVAPDRVRDAFEDVVAAGGFPQVVLPWSVEPVPEVEPPTGIIGRAPAVRTASRSVVRVIGEAHQCDRVIEGSAFVIAPQRIMTNAHVVAGVADPVVTFPEGEPLAARVVYVDPEIDVAVLSVPELRLAPLEFATEPPSSGVDAGVIGYPGNGPLQTTGVRVRGTDELLGRDIYDQVEVVREVVSLRGEIRPGNSGGPVVNTDGQVLGVVFASSLTDPDTGYALSNATIDEALTASEGATDPVATLDCV